LQFLRSKGIYEQAKELSPAFRKIFSSCLQAKDEKILIIGDTGKEDRLLAPLLSGAYYLAAHDLRHDAKLILQQPKEKGEEAEPHVNEAINTLREGNIIITNFSERLGSMESVGKSFRKFCAKAKHRFISSPGLASIPKSLLSEALEPFHVDYRMLQMTHEKILRQLSEGSQLRVTSDAGTDITFSIDGQQGMASDGKYHEPGSGGNLPPGEVYIAPKGKEVNGTIVVDGSSRTKDGTTLVSTPIRIEVASGFIESIEGGREAKALQETLEWAAKRSKYPNTVRRLSGFGIGLNPKAKVIGAGIIDQKALGTAHVGIGSNYWFGGNVYAIIHLDQVFRNPTVSVDGKKIEF